MIKIKRAQAFDNKTIEIEYVDGVFGSFKYEDYFDYRGAMEPLKDINFFKKMHHQNDTLEWPGEIDFCPDVIRSIITQKKFFYNDKVVFDPTIKGKGAWKDIET